MLGSSTSARWPQPWHAPPPPQLQAPPGQPAAAAAAGLPTLLLRHVRGPGQDGEYTPATQLTYTTYNIQSDNYYVNHASYQLE